MIVETVKDYGAMSSVGASIIYDAVMRKLAKGERFNLGLATGNTMITLYDELADKFNRARADLSLLSTWNLDEYASDAHTAVPHDHPLSYWKYMHEMLFEKFDPALGFREENAHFPEPASPETYDPAIAAAGHGRRRLVARAALRRHDGHGAHPRRKEVPAPRLLRGADRAALGDLRARRRADPVPARLLPLAPPRLPPHLHHGQDCDKRQLSGGCGGELEVRALGCIGCMKNRNVL